MLAGVCAGRTELRWHSLVVQFSMGEATTHHRTPGASMQADKGRRSVLSFKFASLVLITRLVGNAQLAFN